jgi:hypothetical protein
MAIEYRLTLDGTTPVEQVAQRALPDPQERPTGTPPLLGVNLDQRYGFAVTIRAGQNGYIEVESDHGMWEWEPQDYVAVTFRLDKEADTEWAVVNMLTIVRRVLETGPEDATLVLNGDYLLFRRVHGALIKHRESWWNNYHVAAIL